MSSPISEKAVEMINVIKIFESYRTSQKISALQGCDLEINEGELVSIIGPSGAGKTTLLNVIGGIEKVSSGEVIVGGYPIYDWPDKLRREFRRKYIGIFSQFSRNNFDPRMSVRDAIKWEAITAGWSSSSAEQQVIDLLKDLDLTHLYNRLCGKLSAGEAMRVSLLKALAKQPFIILADEPSGQLDTENMLKLTKLMQDIVERYNTSILVATHDVRFHQLSDRTLLILNGRLASQEEGSEILKEKLGERPKNQDFSATLFVDSNENVRIPSSILKKLDISKKIQIDYKNPHNFATLKKSYDDPHRINDRDEYSVISNFNRSLIGNSSAIQFENLSKSYYDGRNITKVLEKVQARILEGELLVLLGPSGSGKTTLLNLLSGMEKPDQGKIIINGTNLNSTSFQEKMDIKVNKISYLTQNYIVHPYLSVEENAILPLLLRNQLRNDDNDILNKLINDLEMEGFRYRFPTLLSGGQQQRASLIATIMKNTPILLADEPTANLDGVLAIKVMNKLVHLAEKGKTVIVATHDFTIIRPGFRVIRIGNNKFIEDRVADTGYCRFLQTEYMKSSMNFD